MKRLPATFSRLAQLAFLFALIGGFTGCQPEAQILPETDLTAYQRGQRMLTEDRPQEALLAFQAVVKLRPDEAPESHLEIGRLYLDHFGDPVMAVYHFRRSLEHLEGTDRGPLIEGLIQTAHREFARQLPGGPLNAEVARLDLLALLEEQRTENLQLKRQLAEVTASVARLRRELEAARAAPAPPVAPATSAPEPPATPRIPQAPAPEATDPPTSEGPTEYTVESGDNLYTIARKMYGTPTRWMDIYQANRDQLPNENSLRVGQVLRIPR